MIIELRQNLKTIIGARGGSWVDLPTLLPANTLLELAGESLRPRLYFTNSPAGEELCLRADLTISAALYYLKNCKNKGDYTLLCEGKVFRAPTLDGADVEFTQIGIEKYGNKDSIKADIETFVSMYSAIKGAGLEETKIVLSDGSLIETILLRAKLSPVWHNFLRARAKSINSFEKGILAAIAHDKSKLTDLEAKLINLSDENAQAIVAELINASELQTGPARNTLEIAKRIKAKALLKASDALPNNLGQTLLEILNIKDSPRNALASILSLSSAISIDLKDWFENWQKRLIMIESEIGKDAEIDFHSMTGMRFEYYDGMTFEIAPKSNPELAIAFGGRYDGLLSALSNGNQSISAVGAVIRPERLAEALYG